MVWVVFLCDEGLTRTQKNGSNPIALSDFFLSNTGRSFGRKNKLRRHYWFSLTKGNLCKVECKLAMYRGLYLISQHFNTLLTIHWNFWKKNDNISPSTCSFESYYACVYTYDSFPKATCLVLMTTLLKLNQYLSLDHVMTQINKETKRLTFSVEWGRDDGVKVRSLSYYSGLEAMTQVGIEWKHKEWYQLFITRPAGTKVLFHL